MPKGYKDYLYCMICLRVSDISSHGCEYPDCPTHGDPFPETLCWYKETLITNPENPKRPIKGVEYRYNFLGGEL